MSDKEFQQYTESETERFSKLLATLSTHIDELVEEGKLTDGGYLDSMNGLKAIYEFQHSEMYQRYLRFKYERQKVAPSEVSRDEPSRDKSSV